MALDIDSLLQPISDESPSGENLEYDAAFQALERASAGKLGAYDPVSGETVGAEEPDWLSVRDLSLDLFSRTRDIRVAYLLTLSLLRLDGLPGFATGLGVVTELLERFWPSVYPELIEDEDNDPIERLNVLANLVDPERFLPLFRATTILAARSVGRFNLRDLEIAQGRVEPRQNEQATTLSMLSGAWQEGDPEENAARQAAVGNALSCIARIEAVFQDNAGVSPDLGDLTKLLKTIRSFYAEIGGGSVPLAEAVSDDGDGNPTVFVGASTQIAGGFASRADAIRQLRVVADFLRRTEPSSPAPLMIDRAVKLLEMSFVDIVRELMPDARERIELIGGIKFEEPEY